MANFKRFDYAQCDHYINVVCDLRKWNAVPDKPSKNPKS